MLTKKEKILASIKNGESTIPIEFLVKYIQEKEVSLREMITAGLNDEGETCRKINERLSIKEEALWNETIKLDTYLAYRDYLTSSHSLLHEEEANSRIKEFDDEKWNEVQSRLSESSLNEYLELFPDGSHVIECRNLLNDLPWLETKRLNTIEAYENYMRENPGKHTYEAQAAILSIKDDNEWENACILGISSAFREYLRLFPNGKHAAEAQARLNSGAAGEHFLMALREDPNAYMALDIQQKVGNGVVSWSEIESIFGFEKMNAIRNFKIPTQLPNAIPPDSLQPDTTEVYFWGTPGSGKTCALGTIISSATTKGIIEPLQCAGRLYLDLLSNVFDKGNNICTLPDSTSVGNIQEMMMILRDSKKRQHQLTLIDLAGELFRSVYKIENDLFVPDEDKQVLDKAISYLKDRRNDKIHFFVVEYDAHDKKWDGLNMSNYLSHMIQYLKNKKVFTKSTVGVYVLVTKCDKMKCAVEDRPLEAFNYVQRNLASFWNTLELTCKESAIKDLKTLSFSIGDVFAQQLCDYDGRDTEKVIDKLLTKTHPINNRFGWLRN